MTHQTFFKNQKRTRAAGPSESAVKKDVRAAVLERDGYCRFGSDDPGLRAVVGPCAGLSEWAHLGERRRCHTRGMEPEARHTVEGSAMLCTAHHLEYDANKVVVAYLTLRGADGPIAIINNRNETYREGG